MSSDTTLSPALLEGDLRARDSRFVWHPWSPIDVEVERLMITSGSGTRVTDDAGNEYLDASSLNSTVGYGHPYVIEAMERQLRVLHGVDMSATNHPMAGALAERIDGYLSPEMSRTLLLNSGSEAVEAAIMIASCYWRHLGESRQRVVTFARGYHGSTLLTRSLSGLPPTAHDHLVPLVVDQVELPLPAAELRAPGGLDALADAFATAVDGHEHPPLAVVVEPLLNVGGGVVLPRGFLARLREICDRAGTLLIADEVFTGFGRTGRMFACEHEDVVPDILVSSKGLSGGYAPISAVTTRQDIYSTFKQDAWIGGLRYGHTTAGHAVACAAALATLDIVEQDGLVENARLRGDELLELLAPLAGTQSVRDVRGLGLVVTLEAKDAGTAAGLARQAQARGLLVRQQGEAVLVVPPMIISAHETQMVASRMTDAVEDLHG